MNTYRITLKSGVSSTDFTAENDEELMKELSKGQRGILPNWAKFPEMITPESIEKIELVQEEPQDLE